MSVLTPSFIAVVPPKNHILFDVGLAAVEDYTGELIKGMQSCTLDSPG